MGIIIWFLVGVLVGAGGMFFVYKNNKDKFEAAASEMDLKYADLKAMYVDLKAKYEKKKDV